MKKTKKDLQKYLIAFVDKIDFGVDFDFGKTIETLPHFNPILMRIIKHPEEINKILSKESEFIISIPENDESKFNILEKGKSYKTIIWKILKDRPSKRNLILKMYQEGNIIFSGLEGLEIVEKFAKKEIPFGPVIFSFSKEEREDLVSFCHHENSGVVEYGSISKHSTIISKRNKIISFYEIK